MPKFFVDKNQIRDRKIIITGEDVKHIYRVLRLKIGDTVTVCDGLGTDYEARLSTIDLDVVEAEIINKASSSTEPPVNITLYQGLPKSDKMDLIIQKSVELGVAGIIPVLTERTVVKLDGKKDIESKVKRWQRISLEAAKQCNRGIIPLIGAPVSFKTAIEQMKDFDLGLIPYEKERTKGIRESIINKKVTKIAVFIGPEGGFTEVEIELAKAQGVIPVTLGPRILRTETAGIMVLSILMYDLGDL